jgi:Lrp/AsnC family transcriptional regulator, leucine-responsive regulatory protein
VQVAVSNAVTAQESCKIRPMQTPIPLDAIDRRILRALQADGRMTYDVLKRLEQSGAVQRYVAIVSPEHVGLPLTAYLNVRLEKHTERHKRNPMDLFRAAVQTWPEVIECAALTGEMDFLLRVVVADMAHYSRFVLDTLLKHPSVQDCKTSFVLDRVKNTSALPV